MKIYTSRFSNPELATGKYTVVGIVRSLPRFPLKYKLAGNIIEFAPPGYLWNENDREVFRPKYFEHMDSIGMDRAAELLFPYMEMGKDIVLCCYEDVRLPHGWCHRQVFAEWWEANFGQKIEELYNPTEPKEKKKTLNMDEIVYSDFS